MVKCIFAVCLASAVCIQQSTGFWDVGTTTFRNPRDKDEGRTSFFRWQWTYIPGIKAFFRSWDFEDIYRRMRLGTVCGLSIDWQCITTCVLMTRRLALTSHNAMYPHIVRQHDIRLWAPGPEAKYNTPFRYRVYRVHPVSPRSGNMEHCHGPFCAHQPRHDVAVVVSRDQIYLYNWWWYSPYYIPTRYFYPFRSQLAQTSSTFTDEDIWYGGSGFEYMEHIRENYKIFYGILYQYHIMDCSKYLPKWWGKFICIRNWRMFPGIQNGGPLFQYTYVAQIIMGLGCFEIRYNDEKIFVFTDLRYYRHKIAKLANIQFHAYYEFAYPQWGVQLSYITTLTDSTTNDPMVPFHYWIYHIDDGYLLG